MGKYFTNDSDLLKYSSDDTSVDMTKNAMPDISHQERQLSASEKSILDTPKDTPPKNESIYDKIDEIQEQNQKLAEEFNRIGREKVKQTFKSFDELEVLERLNQITFLLIQQNNRIENIEKALINNINTVKTNESMSVKTPSEMDVETQTPKDISELTPTEKHILETSKKESLDGVDLMNPNVVAKELNKIKSGQVPNIPLDGLVDNGVKLEEMFPGKDPEAYQAAYKSIEEKERENQALGYSKSPKGGLNGSNAGF